ncbi:uncharacterized protein LOC121709940 isoform X2 [Alosa sapidissima]|uniref:uncharacterized protein LOC121709940 isoform X2 n=1 Tax=Alosa sapidissima TaxID=34773 RepID=UPI001C09C988|nr:uncharacterized protein LOC121709940 isoform X2 [Alosa sapidissima]
MQCMPSFEPSMQGLNVKHFKSNHSGSYSCIITGIIPPPIRELNTTIIKLHAGGLSLELVNTTDSGCVELVCTMDAIDQEQVEFIWNSRGKNTSEQKQVTNSSSSVSSSLRLCGAERRDGDTITCSVSLPSDHFTSNWTIHQQNVGNEDSNWMVKTICICALTGAMLMIAMAVIIYKCKKRKNLDDASVVYTNKVYENFNFGTRIPIRESRREMQHEDCIYEN